MIKKFNEKIYLVQLKMFNISFDQILHITYPYASIKDIQATGEAFSSQKRTSSTLNDENSCLDSSLEG
jgi:hypothetical protein